MLRVIYGEERARVYAAGGIDFDERMEGLSGWILCERPGLVIQQLALAARSTVYPHLPALQLADLAD